MKDCALFHDVIAVLNFWWCVMGPSTDQEGVMTGLIAWVCVYWLGEWGERERKCVCVHVCVWLCVCVTVCVCVCVCGWFGGWAGWGVGALTRMRVCICVCVCVEYSQLCLNLHVKLITHSISMHILCDPSMYYTCIVCSAIGTTRQALEIILLGALWSLGPT